MEYYSPLDHDGQRQDLEQRPELRSGSVEYVAPQEYMVIIVTEDFVCFKHQVVVCNLYTIPHIQHVKITVVLTGQDLMT